MKNDRPVRLADGPPVTAARSRNMRAVRRADTEPEVRLRRLLWRAGMRYRKNLRTAGTTPDLVFLGARVAVFVDGCFWHGCPEHYRTPATRSEYWQDRLRRNMDRDVRDTLRLEAAGYRVVRVWACRLRTEPQAVVGEIRRATEGGRG